MEIISEKLINGVRCREPEPVVLQERRGCDSQIHIAAWVENVPTLADQMNLPAYAPAKKT